MILSLARIQWQPKDATNEAVVNLNDYSETQISTEAVGSRQGNRKKGGNSTQIAYQQPKWKVKKKKKQKSTMQ